MQGIGLLTHLRVGLSKNSLVTRHLALLEMLLKIKNIGWNVENM